MPDNMPPQLGNYRLIRLIGRGGFADVYLGQHIHLQTLAAIKVLQTRLAGEDQQRFYTEAVTIARLDHPNIVHVLDFGVEGNIPYLVTVYAPAGTLRQLYPKNTQVPLYKAVAHVRQAASALDYAHRQHVVHRDVKPENMLIGPSGAVLLTDFGIALVTQSSRYQTTQEVVGTVLYMAPEQLQGRPRPASDQYALGIVVYEWLTGGRPFHGSFAEVGSQHMFAPPPSIRERAPGISPDVEQVVLTALAKDPLQRFPTIQAFADAFEQSCTATLRHGPSRPLSGTHTPIIAETNYQRTFIPTPPSGPPLANTSGVPPSRKWLERLVSRRGVLVGLVGAAALAVGATVLAFAESQKGVVIHPVTPTPKPSGVVSPQPTQTHQPAPTSQPTHEPQPTLQPTGHPQPTTQPTTQPTQRPTTQPTTQPTQPRPTTQPTQPRPTTQPTTQPTSPSGAGNTLNTYSQQQGQIYTVAWSPDGQNIASGANDQTVAVWNALTSVKPFSPYTGHSSQVFAVAWSPNGRYIASGSNDHTVQVWDASNGAFIAKYTALSSSVNAISWSQDNVTLAFGSSDNNVYVWNFMINASIFNYAHGGAVRCVAWSPDGQYIVSGGDDGKALVYTASNGGSQLNTYSGHSGTVWGVAWSPDSTQVVSGGDDRTAQVWNYNGSTANTRYSQHQDTVTAVDWSHVQTTHILSASNDRTVQIWDATSGNQVTPPYTGHNAGVSTARWSPTQLAVASGGQNGTVLVWQGA